MPRFRVSALGLQLAKYGFDVDTAAPANMAFAANMVALRLALEGTVGVAAHSEGPPYTSYYKGTVTFGTPFPEPPMVMVAGIGGDGTSYQAPFVINTAGGGVLEVTPHYQVNTYEDHFDLYAMQWTAGGVITPTSWKYFVLQNTLTA